MILLGECSTLPLRIKAVHLRLRRRLDHPGEENFMSKTVDPPQALLDISRCDQASLSTFTTFGLGPQETLEYRRRFRVMIGVASKLPLKDRSVVSLVYTPGVAAPCLEIAKDPLTSFDYTIRGNTIALVTDGSSAFGLGNIGPIAALPMLEDACILFKTFAGVDAFPICLDTQNVEEIINVGMALRPTFGGICLSSIASPRCFTV